MIEIYIDIMKQISGRKIITYAKVTEVPDKMIATV